MMSIEIHTRCTEIVKDIETGEKGQHTPIEINNDITDNTSQVGTRKGEVFMKLKLIEIDLKSQGCVVSVNGNTI